MEEKVCEWGVGGGGVFFAELNLYFLFCFTSGPLLIDIF